MPILGTIIKSAIDIRSRIPARRNVYKQQVRQLLRLIDKAQDTAFGKQFGFHELSLMADPIKAFQKRVPSVSRRWFGARSNCRYIVGAGARSPGLIPALSAAAVGRITRICRDGTTVTGFASGAPFVGTVGAARVSTTGAAASWTTCSSSAGSGSAAGGCSRTCGAGASARAAGVNRLTSFVGAAGFGCAEAAGTAVSMGSGADAAGGAAATTGSGS